MSICKHHPLSIRIPPDMRDRIRERAAANRRSMNAEIVHYLDRALADQNEIGAASAATDPRHGSTNP